MNMKKLTKPFLVLNNAFGDVAKEIHSDENFPDKINSIDDLPDHLLGNEAFMDVFYYFSLNQGMLFINDGKLTWYHPYQ